MKPTSTLTIQHLVFAVSLLVLSLSFYLQYAKGLEPCPLCLMQRLCILLVLTSSGINLLFKPFRRGLLIATISFAIAGFYFASRQVWLMSLSADQVPACVPGLNVLIRYFPWQDVAHALFWGSGNCTEITWSWLGLSLPTWSAGYFLLIAIASSALYCKHSSCFTRRPKT